MSRAVLLSRARPLLRALVLLLALLPWSAAPADRKGSKPAADPYADYVWPPPPDPARLKLEAVIATRADVEGESKLKRALIGASTLGPWDVLKKPFAVAFDPEGRVLVTDWQSGALVRIDVKGRRWDVLGTQGAVHLKAPLGLEVARDGTIYVADGGLQKVIAFRPDGKVKAVYGKAGELQNPTDAALSPDGRSLYVVDSRAHGLVVFDVATGARLRAIGKVGEGKVEFAYPTSATFGPDGSLFVVDQLNARVQVLTAAGAFVGQLGQLGIGFGNFVRPKDVAVDEAGLVYVSDNAFNNFQIFDADFALLTFVGEAGVSPGRFHGLSGVAVQRDRVAAVDQLGRRVQLFRFVAPKTQR